MTGMQGVYFWTSLHSDIFNHYRGVPMAKRSICFEA